MAGDREVVIDWEKHANDSTVITHWQYQQGSGGWTDVPDSGDDTRSHTVTGLSNGTQYAFKVRAVNAVGAGPESSASSATPKIQLPDKPTGLSAAIGHTVVVLTWDRQYNDRITKWQYSKDNGATWTDVCVTSSDPDCPAATSETVTGLTNDTEYTFRVRAVTSAGNGPSSDAVKATPKAVPSPPSIGNAAPGNTGEIVLTWTASSNDTAWQYRYKTTGDYGDWVNIPCESPCDPGTLATHTVTGLDNNIQYTFQVRAKNGIGWGLPVEFVGRPVAGKPAAPTLDTAEGGDRYVKLTWTHTDTKWVDQWQYTTDDGTTWKGIADAGNSARSATVTPLANGKSYTFKLRAKNGKGESAASGAQSAATLPLAPATFSVAGGYEKATLTWTKSSSDATVTGWEYTHKKGAGSYRSWTAVPGSTGTTTTHDVTNLDNNASYTFMLRAVNATGRGAAFATAKQAWTAPGKPTNLSITPGDLEATLSWTNPTGGDTVTGNSYRYKPKSNTDSGWTDWTDISGGAKTSQEVTGLTNGVSYSFQVRAHNGSGAGTPSDEKSAWTYPAAPSNLAATPGNALVSLTWDDPSNSSTPSNVASVNMLPGKTSDFTAEKEFESPSFDIDLAWKKVQRNNADDSSVSGWELRVVFAKNGASAAAIAAELEKAKWQAVPNSGVNTTQYTSESNANAQYSFHVRAVNAAGSGPASDTGSVTLTPASPAAFSVTVTEPAVDFFNGPVNGGTAALSWTAANDSSVNDASILYYQYRESATDKWRKITCPKATGCGSLASHALTLRLGRTYAIQLRAVNIAGEGAASTAVTVVTPPAAPNGFQVATGSGRTSASLKWNKPAATDTADEWQYRQLHQPPISVGDYEWSATLPDADEELNIGGGYGVGAYTWQDTAPGTSDPAGKIHVGAETSGARTVTLTPTSANLETLEAHLQDKGEARIGAWTVALKGDPTFTKTGAQPTVEFDATTVSGTPPSSATSIIPVSVSQSFTAAGTYDWLAGALTTEDGKINIGAKEGGTYPVTITAVSPHYATLRSGLEDGDQVRIGDWKATVKGTPTFEMHGQRDSAKEFSLSGPTGAKPYGMWSDGTTAWVYWFRNTTSWVYAYTLSSGARDTTKDLTLDAANDNAVGITGSSTHIYIADDADDKIYAYKRSGNFGDRDSAKDIDLNSANASPVAIWTDGTTMWVSDGQDDMLYAYKLSDGSRDSGKDYGTLSAAGNNHPVGIWSDGTTTWVSDSDNNKLYAYKASDQSRDSSKDFYLAAGNTHPDGVWANSTTFYAVNTDPSDKKVYAYTKNSIANASHDSSSTFAPAAPSTSYYPRGAWGDATTLWVSWSANTGDGYIYAYNRSNGSRDTTKDITPDTGNDKPGGMWSDGTTLWVSDWEGKKLYAYKRSDGSRDSGKDISLHSTNASASGLWSDGTTMWVADRDDSMLYAYKRSDGSRDSANDYTAATLTAAGNGYPHGLWSDGKTLWVSDYNKGKVYAYKMSNKSRDAAKDARLASGNDDPYGLWVGEGRRLYVVNDTNDTATRKVYVYDLSVFSDATRGLVEFNAVNNDEAPPSSGTSIAVAIAPPEPQLVTLTAVAPHYANLKLYLEKDDEVNVGTWEVTVDGDPIFTDGTGDKGKGAVQFNAETVKNAAPTGGTAIPVVLPQPQGWAPWTPMPDANISKTAVYKYEVSSLADDSSYLFQVRGVYFDDTDPANIDTKPGAHSGYAIYDIKEGVAISQQGPVTLTSGGSGSYTIQLTKQPTANVTIAIASNNAEITVSPTSHTFTTLNWNVGQEVTITSNTGRERKYSLGAIITHTVTSTDPAYNNIDVDDVEILSRPWAKASAPRSAAANAKVTLDGSKSEALADPWAGADCFPISNANCSDADLGQPLTYAWSQPDGQNIELSEVEDEPANRTFTAPGSGTTLYFTLTVTDTRNRTDTDTVSINVATSRGTGPGGPPGGGPPGSSPTVRPAKPEGLTATPDYLSVTLRWNDPQDDSITGYQYRQKTGQGDYGPWTDVPDSVATTTNHKVMFQPDDAGILYYFQIRAVNASGESDASDEAGATPTSQPAPPTSLTAVGGDKQAALQWTASIDSDAVTGYQYRYKADEESYGTWTDADSTSVTYTVTGLENGRTYTFQVRAAVDATAYSEPSNEAVATILTAPVATPTAPTGLKAQGWNKSVALSWDATSNTAVTSYQFRQKVRGGSVRPVDIHGGLPRQDHPPRRAKPEGRYQVHLPNQGNSGRESRPTLQRGQRNDPGSPARTDAGSDASANAGPNGSPNTRPDANAHRDADRDGHAAPHANAHRNADCDASAHREADTDADTHTCHRRGDVYCHADRRAGRDAYCDCDSRSGVYADACCCPRTASGARRRTARVVGVLDNCPRNKRRGPRRSLLPARRPPKTTARRRQWR